MAVPSLASVRRMMFSNWAGSVRRPLVVTGKVCCTGCGVGAWPMRPTANWLFCWVTALAMSEAVMPRPAMRSGDSQMRMAESTLPKIDAWLAPGMRLMASRTKRLV